MVSDGGRSPARIIGMDMPSGAMAFSAEDWVSASEMFSCITSSGISGDALTFNDCYISSDFTSVGSALPDPITF